MSAKTSIAWTNATWSPLRARVKEDAAEIAKQKGYTSLIQIAEKMAGHVGHHCEHASDGCKHCYSEANNSRCLPSNGTGLPFDRRSRDLVEPFVDEKILRQPLSWKQPKRIFVESQSDLFGEWYTDEQIDRVFMVMACAPRHTFQVLTKRADRMLSYLLNRRDKMRYARTNECPSLHYAFPDFLRNVWIGVSVENQATADTRIPLLAGTPAAIRFVSYEPALEAVDFLYPKTLYPTGAPQCCSGIDCGCRGRPIEPPLIYDISWLIVGGESGPAARQFDMEWVSDSIRQCSYAGVRCFVKQMGSKPFRMVYPQGWTDPEPYRVEPKFKDRAGADPSEWPAEFRVQQFPIADKLQEAKGEIPK